MDEKGTEVPTAHFFSGKLESKPENSALSVVKGGSPLCAEKRTHDE